LFINQRSEIDQSQILIFLFSKENKMSQLTLSQTQKAENAHSDWNHVIQLGGIVAWLQLACVLITSIVLTIVGGEPATAAEYYGALNGGIAGLLRLDFATLILVALMPFVALGLYAAFHQSRPAYALLAMIMILMGTFLALANHSAFSLMHLGDLYAVASPVAQAQLLTVGEAVIASDMWHTTAGFLAGIFMQGGFVFISFVMLRTPGFGKGTAYTGILANGLDLLHVFIALFAPALASILLAVGGVFYLIWFPLLGRDMVRFGKANTFLP
jgi:hypothetical protein